MKKSVLPFYAFIQFLAVQCTIVCSLHAQLIPETDTTYGIVLAAGDSYKPIHDFHSDIINNLPNDVKVFYLGENSAYFLRKKLENFVPLDLSTDSSWVRDYFPEQVLNSGKLNLTTFEYSEQKYPVASSIYKFLPDFFKIPISAKSNLKLQGGNLLVDEKQNLFVADVILDQNQNFSIPEIKQKLKQILKVKSVEIFPSMPYEPTGHIDIYLKYVGNNTMLLASDSESDVKKEMLNSVEYLLIQKKYKVVRIMNSPSLAPALTYTNSTIVNDTVFVPQYADKLNYPDEYQKSFKYDQEAIKIYQKLGFKKVIGIKSRMLINHNGAVHCLTKNIHFDSSFSSKHSNLRTRNMH